MKAIARVRNIHCSSSKVKLVIDLIRNKKVTEALIILDHTNKKVAYEIKKLLNSAISNATNNHSMQADKLYIYQIFVSQGRTNKRTLPRAKGSANLIRKRHSHITIVLSDDPQEKQKDLALVKQKMANKKQKVMKGENK